MWFRNKIKTGAALTVAVCSLPGLLFGDLKESLEARRAAFETELATKGEPHLLLYAVELEKLERELVAKRDYAAAIIARDEAKAIRRKIFEHSLGNGGAAPGVSNRLIFEAKSATTSLGVTIDAESGSLRGWRTSDDFARWQLPDIEPGEYEVILEYAAGSSEGGEVVVAESFFTLAGKIEGGGGSETVRKNLGTLKIRSGGGVLSISPTTVAVGGLMRLKSIELVPAWR